MAKQQKKTMPAKNKPATGKKTGTPLKKASAVLSRSSAKTAVVKNGAAKKIAPKKASKQVSVKKAVPKKAAAGKSSNKTISSKKQIPKKVASAKTIANPILKSAPAKKTANPVMKKAAPKKLATSKNTPVSKSTGIEKKVTEIQKKQKTVEKPEAVEATDHKKKLKTALLKSSEKETAKKAPKPFVMPKTNTEKSRKYEPQFVKSVLDQVPEENNGPSMRYSDSELMEFRELITRKLETAKKELGYLQGLITRKDEMGGDDTDNRYMTMEDGSLSMEREQLSQMASRQITFIDHLEKAMMRIENKTYGICRVTGKLIDKARLRAVPHATLSIEAKMGISR